MNFSRDGVMIFPTPMAGPIDGSSGQNHSWTTLSESPYFREITIQRVVQQF